MDNHEKTFSLPADEFDRIFGDDMSDMVRLTCKRCGFDGHYARDFGHQCRVFVSMDEYEKLKEDAERYRWLRANDWDSPIVKLGYDEYENAKGAELDLAIDAMILPQL